MLRIAFFLGDHRLVATRLGKARQLLETGGDWEGKNRLRAYEGLHCVAVRDFSKAAGLLLDTVATFVAHELCTYTQAR